MVGVVDFGWAGAVGPSESSALGDLGAQFAAGCHAVVSAAAEEQLVGVGAAAAGPVSVNGGLRSDNPIPDNWGGCSHGRGRSRSASGRRWRRVFDGPDTAAVRCGRRTPQGSEWCWRPCRSDRASAVWSHHRSWWRWHRDRRIGGGVSGLVEFGQCRGDDHGDRVAAVHTESAGSDRGSQPELQRVMAALGGRAVIARFGFFDLCHREDGDRGAPPLRWPRSRHGPQGRASRTAGTCRRDPAGRGRARGALRDRRR